MQLASRDVGQSKRAGNATGAWQHASMTIGATIVILLQEFFKLFVDAVTAADVLLFCLQYVQCCCACTD